MFEHVSRPPRQDKQIQVSKPPLPSPQHNSNNRWCGIGGTSAPQRRGFRDPGMHRMASINIKPQREEKPAWASERKENRELDGIDHEENEENDDDDDDDDDDENPIEILR